MIISSESHLDHNLTAAHLAFILAECKGRDAFFIESFEMPEDLPALPCALYGPLIGDEPISDDDVTLETRGDRGGPSRLVDKPKRPSRTITVIAGPHEDLPCVMYTAYGGPSGATKEPWDCAEGEEREAAEAFWAVHALAK